MALKYFYTQEMFVTKSLKTKNSFGSDEMSTKLLKANAIYICHL